MRFVVSALQSQNIFGCSHPYRVSTHFHTELLIFFFVFVFAISLKFFSIIFISFLFFAKYIIFLECIHMCSIFVFNSFPFPLFKYAIKLIWTIFYFLPFDSSRIVNLVCCFVTLNFAFFSFFVIVFVFFKLSILFFFCFFFWFDFSLAKNHNCD